jgi:drug/metabolite transporter, DME family
LGGEVAALAGAFTWALTTVLLKEPVNKMGALAVNNLRTWIGAFVFIALLVATGRVSDLLAVPTSAALILACAIIIGLGIGDTLYFESVKLIGVSRAMPISGCYPLPTFAITALWLGEQVKLPYILGTALIIIAIYLTSLPDRRIKSVTGGSGRGKISTADFRRGVILAIVSALLWALSTAMLKFAVGETDLVVANAIRLPAAGLVLLVVALRQPGGLRIKGSSKTTLGIVALTGIVGTALGSFLYLTAVVLAGAGRTAALQSVAPFFGAPLALIFLKERIAPPVIVGTLLSVVGVWLLIAG